MTDNTGLLPEPALAPIAEAPVEPATNANEAKAKRLLKRLQEADASYSDIADAKRLIEVARTGGRGFNEKYADLTGFLAWKKRRERQSKQ